MRLQAKEQKERLVTAALEVARKQGLRGLTREALAGAAGVSPALVSFHLGTMTTVRRAVMRAAVDREVLTVIAEGLATRDKQALRAAPELRARALATLG